jgi:hypothetical protein
MFEFSERIKSFLIGLGIFMFLVLFFYLTKINGDFILSIYLVGFWIYILFIDLKNIRNNHISNETYDNPSIEESINFCKTWKMLKNGCQTLGFILLLFGFLTDNNTPLFMILGTILLSVSLLFDSMYVTEVKKIKELQLSERNN